MDSNLVAEASRDWTRFHPVVAHVCVITVTGNRDVCIHAETLLCRWHGTVIRRAGSWCRGPTCSGNFDIYNN